MQVMWDEIVIANINEDNDSVELVEGIPVKLVPSFFKDNTKVSIGDLKEWLVFRVPPKTRGNIKVLLKEMGLKKYNVYEVAKKTRASLVGDRWWLKVETTDTFETSTLLGQSGEKTKTIEEYLKSGF